jgi:hypothetical protein
MTGGVSSKGARALGGVRPEVLRWELRPEEVKSPAEELHGRGKTSWHPKE